MLLLLLMVLMSLLVIVVMEDTLLNIQSLKSTYSYNISDHTVSIQYLHTELHKRINVLQILSVNVAHDRNNTSIRVN